jgi:putative membrane protein
MGRARGATTLASRLKRVDQVGGESGTRCMLRAMLKLIVKWLLLASALLFVAYVYDGVQVTTFGAAMLAAFVIGLLNTVVRPVLVILTLPVTVLTVGLFIFIINALMFWLAAELLDGFQVRSFFAALIGSVMYSVLGMIVDSALEFLFAKK